MKNDVLKTINPEAFYTPRAVMSLGGWPWKSAMTFNSYIKTKRGRDVFNPVMKYNEKTNKSRYFIRGSTILEIVRLMRTNKIVF